MAPKSSDSKIMIILIINLYETISRADWDLGLTGILGSLGSFESVIIFYFIIILVAFAVNLFGFYFQVTL